MRRLALALSVTLVVAGCASPSLGFLDQSNAGMGRMDVVKRVRDGDTFVLERGDQAVRVLGIDTPETVHPNKPVECGGPQASAWAEHTLPPGTQVRVDFEPGSAPKDQIDRYGRLLGYVMYRSPGSSVWKDYSVETARAGFAKNYVYDKPVSRQNQIAEAEQDAKNNRRGMWSFCKY